MSTTVSGVVLRHQQKKDGTFNVKIRLTHNRVSRYIDTAHFVTEKQMNRDKRLRESFISVPVFNTLRKYREVIAGLEHKLPAISCDQLKEILIQEDKQVDFVAFCQEYIQQLRSEKKNNTAGGLRSVVNSLKDFFRRDVVFVSEITSLMLKQYERYLLTSRKLKRIHRRGTQFTITSPPLSVSGVYNHMRDLRILFNHAKNHYNDEDLDIMRITHYPFKSYKLQKPPETRKRNLSIDCIRKIRDYQPEKIHKRAELARDLFMLSIYMCGTNAVDFYHMKENNINRDRLEYKRAKTKSKRIDEAFISIKIVDQAEPLLKKYLGKLSNRFSTNTGLSTALSTGMRILQKELDIPEVTYYWARHSFATIARNTCRRSKDDIALALNHVDEGRKTTDIYIEKDWSIIDEVQQAVINEITPKTCIEIVDMIKPISILGQINLIPCKR